MLRRFRLPGFVAAMGATGLAGQGDGRGETWSAENFRRRVERELRGNILPFWIRHAPDRVRGGFHGAIDHELTVRPDAPRGALLTSRVLWTYSAAHRRYGDPSYLEMARRAFEDLQARFWDERRGGLFWSITAEGKPRETRKLAYVQAFGIYGLSEFYRATGDKAALERAREIFRLLESNARDREHGGYFEEFTRDWRVSRERGRKSPMGSRGQKSQNVHLHLMEAYANLFRAWPDAELAGRLRELVSVMRTRVLDAKAHRLRLFFDEDRTPQPDATSFGHDIEFAWLLVDAAEALGDDGLIAEAKRESVEIARAALARGVDRDGGVFAEMRDGRVTDRFKEWWTQAEAAVGFLEAHENSGDRVFWEASQPTWLFIEDRLVDRRKGEWFMGVEADGRVRPGKVTFWKGPYHNGRACMELLARLEGLEKERR